MRAGATLAGLAGLALLAGCGLLGKPPEFDLVGPRVALMPLADEPERGWYGETRRARRLHARIRRALADGGVELVESDTIAGRLSEFTGDVVPWIEYGRRMRADYVVHGRILRYQVGDPRTIGFFPGEMTVEMTVDDVETGRQAFRKEIAIKVPDPLDRRSVAPLMLDTYAKAEAALLLRMALAWREVFCGGEG